MRIDIHVASLQHNEVKVIVLQKLIGWYEAMVKAFPEQQQRYAGIIDKYENYLAAPQQTGYLKVRLDEIPNPKKQDITLPLEITDPTVSDYSDHDTTFLE